MKFIKITNPREEAEYWEFKIHLEKLHNEMLRAIATPMQFFVHADFAQTATEVMMFVAHRPTVQYYLTVV